MDSLIITKNLPQVPYRKEIPISTIDIYLIGQYVYNMSHCLFIIAKPSIHVKLSLCIKWKALVVEAEVVAPDISSLIFGAHFH